MSQGKEQTVLGESALSRYSDLSLKAYSQSVIIGKLSESPFLPHFMAKQARKSAAVGSLRLPRPLAPLLLASLRGAAVAGTHDGAATNNKTTTLR